LLSVGQLFSFTFDEPGTYPYYCDNHGGPGGEGMSGVIIVVP
jgi:plastocyanin